MARFVHLHVHSHYSLLDGLGKIDQILDRCEELGMDSIALTDHGNMYGAIEFYTKAKERGIKPIIGVEAYIAPGSMHSKIAKVDANASHLVLLAKDFEGYQNLLKIVSAAQIDGYYYVPRIDKEFLSSHSKGLIGMSACLKGVISQIARVGDIEKAEKEALEYQKIFGKGNFYLELMHHPGIEDQKKVNERIIKIAQKTKIPVVATNDVHYINKEDAEAQDVLLCIQMGKTVEDENRISLTDSDFSIRSGAEMSNSFKDVPEAVLNTSKIAEKCNLELKLDQVILPHFALPKGKGKDEFNYLVELCEKGVLEHYNFKAKKDISKEVKERLDYELSVIKKTGFASYFLIVADFVNHAKEAGIMVGPGRGSAAGSLVSYALNITEIDPFKYDLIFERFLNPDRIEMPDIDLDFADSRRGEVIDYVCKKYGADHVAQIVTFGTMQARNAIRDTGRALGISYGDVDKIAKLIPFGTTIKDALNLVPELKEEYKNPDYKKLIDMAQRLEGVVRHASTHAAGVVISKKPLTYYAPLQKSTRDEALATTQYSMYNVAKIGLLKIDFLGLSNLTILQEAVKIIKHSVGKEIDLSEMPLDDKKTFELLARGETVGVFQLESDGMRRYIKQLQPTQFEDLIAMVALYRPGPMEWIPKYIDGKHGRTNVEYIHPKLEPILDQTYGIPVYQEQILQIARDLAGFSFSEADVLRKAVGKKIKKLLMEQQVKFTDGLIKNGIAKETAERIWNFIEPFARYGFNKAHATCYAMIAYQTAYLKANWPAEFMAALLTSDQGNIDRVAIEVAECSRLGIEVLPPSINESFQNFTVTPDGNIRFGLGAVKNVGKGIINAIIEARKEGKFKSLEDFLSRVNHLEQNKKVLESLIKCGAMDELGKRERMLYGVEVILKYGRKVQGNTSAGQTDIFGLIGSETTMPLNLPEVSEIESRQKLAWERELLGLYISAHPLDEFKKLLEKQTYHCGNLSENLIGQKIRLAGIVTDIQKVITRNNQPMIFARFEDLFGNIEVLVFPKILEKDSLIWQKDKVLIIDGKINAKDGSLKFLCDEVVELTKELLEDLNPEPKYIFSLTLPKDGNGAIFRRVLELLSDSKGKDAEVLISIPNGEKPKRVKLGFMVGAVEELKVKLNLLLGEEAVKIEAV